LNNTVTKNKLVKTIKVELYFHKLCDRKLRKDVSVIESALSSHLMAIWHKSNYENKAHERN